MAAGPSRRFALFLIIGFTIILLFFLGHFHSTSIASRSASQLLPAVKEAASGQHVNVQDADLKGHTIMPKLGNETAKAELGRAAWKLLHTTMARFPEKPTSEESGALKAYLHLFQRLYPCGECASHFRTILDKYPPQVSSRQAAAGWACFVHNEVNKSLKKEEFDCNNIGDFYDCGCADEDKPAAKVDKVTQEKPELDDARKEKLTGMSGREFNEDYLVADTLPIAQTEGPTRGG